MRRYRSLTLVLAASIVASAFAAPALAPAATPNSSWFLGRDDAGDDVSVHIARNPKGSPFVDRAEFRPAEEGGEFKEQSDFERAGMNDGHFGTCAKERVNEVFFREYCILGHFDKPDHVSGTVRIFISAGGQRWPKPLGYFRWEGDQSGP